MWTGLKDVYKLQETLVKTFSARALAVKKVVTNPGKNTPGIDNIIWDDNDKRIKAIIELKELNRYEPQALRRIYIPKSNGKMRPLSIPTVKDRAVQTLYAMGLDPISEYKADTRSYGYRKYRSTQDVQQYLRKVLANEDRAEWIMDHIPMNKQILKKWLECGYLEKQTLFETEAGVPQGGIISPIIANMALDGLQQKLIELKRIVTKSEGLKSSYNPKINYVRFADDFIITSDKKEYYEKYILPVVKDFLKERGLELNIAKTQIYNIYEGFDFLGFNFKKYKTIKKEKGNTLLIHPSKKSIKKLMHTIKLTIRKHRNNNARALISELNPILRGWANYYKFVNSKEAFKKIQNHLFWITWNWSKTKHSKKCSRKFLRKTYYHVVGKRRWAFGYREDGKLYELFNIGGVKIQNYIMIKDINPYSPENREYLASRIVNNIKQFEFNDPRVSTLLKRDKGLCPVCERMIDTNDPEEIEVHHKKPKSQGGPDTLNNLVVLHKTCHKVVTHTKDESLKAKLRIKGIIL